ncbi:MAG: dienelactone hydrolase family protein [Chloroflexi bacterium]|nr:dienelactone hydrolase family protein [Chloroflexota bacterium]
MYTDVTTRRLSLGNKLVLFSMLAVALLGCRATEVSPPTSTPTTAPAPTDVPTPFPSPIPAEYVVIAGVSFPGQEVPIKAYEVRPPAAGPFPALIVIHENRGLTEHIKDVTRRFAEQGYVALGVDLLSRPGGRERFATDDEAVAAINSLSREGVVQDLQSAFDYLASRPYVRADHIGVIGYCWGGGNSLLMATRVQGLRTAVVYYGPNPPNLDDVANIGGPVLGIYGEQDTRITVNVPALAEALKRHNKAFEYKVYPGAAHAFFNDTGSRYNAESAADAWTVTLAFLEKNLKG